MRKSKLSYSYSDYVRALNILYKDSNDIKDKEAYRIMRELITKYKNDMPVTKSRKYDIAYNEEYNIVVKPITGQKAFDSLISYLIGHTNNLELPIDYSNSLNLDIIKTKYKKSRIRRKLRRKNK